MRIDIKKISKTLLGFLENRLGLIVLLIFVGAILYATFIFYNFAYKTVLTLPEAFYTKITIKKDIFDQAVEQLELREQNISEAMEKEYPDVFR